MGLGGWNVGGTSLALLHTSLQDLELQHDLCFSAVALQEVPRGEIGWSTSQVGKWEIHSFQNAVDWRGTGIAFIPTQWAVIRRKPSPLGCWFRLRRVDTGQDVWVGSVYVPPHYDTGGLQQALQDHRDILPATQLPVFLFEDVNAALRWTRDDEGCVAYGEDSKSRTLLDSLHSGGLQPNPPNESQLHQRTSRPRKDNAMGWAIDWVAVKHVPCNRTDILTDSCYLMGTDHDMIATSFVFPALNHRGSRIRTGKRVVYTKPGKVDVVNQPVLRSLARQHTGPPRGQGYKDSCATRALFHQAKCTKLPADWKLALRARKRKNTNSGEKTKFTKHHKETGGHSGHANPKLQRGGRRPWRRICQGMTHTRRYTSITPEFSTKGKPSTPEVNIPHPAQTLPWKRSDKQRPSSSLAKVWDMMGSALNSSGRLSNDRKVGKPLFDGLTRSYTRDRYLKTGIAW